MPKSGASRRPSQGAVGADHDDAKPVTQQRLDKWLWFARLVKTRTLATSLVSGGKVRVNKERVTKPSYLVGEGDVITVALQRHVRVLKVVATGTRRGPAKEAVELYDDQSVPMTQPTAEHKRMGIGRVNTGGRAEGAGRPTKKDRRAIDRLRWSETTSE